MDLPKEIQKVVAEQGWNDGSLLSFALEFIREKELMDGFVAHLEEWQEQENYDAVQEELDNADDDDDDFWEDDEDDDDDDWGEDDDDYDEGL